MAAEVRRIDIGFRAARCCRCGSADPDYDALRRRSATRRPTAGTSSRRRTRRSRSTSRRSSTCGSRPDAPGRVLALRSVLRSLDLGLLRVLRTRGHSPRVESAVLALARTGEHGLLWQAAAGAGLLVDRPRRDRSTGGPCATVLATMVANTRRQVRGAAGRARRWRACPALTPTISGRSYPSAHASTSFAAARVLSEALPRRRSTRSPARWRCRAPTSACTTRPTSPPGALLGDAVARWGAPSP